METLQLFGRSTEDFLLSFNGDADTFEIPVICAVQYNWQTDRGNTLFEIHNE